MIIFFLKDEYKTITTSSEKNFFTLKLLEYHYYLILFISKVVSIRSLRNFIKFFKNKIIKKIIKHVTFFNFSTAMF